jgi:putative FmdB family regulatory protein
MPIYAYRCTACGHAKDVLQKISDPLLSVCPACGAQTFVKQVTAAGFQLKGSGWYVTDFKGGAAPAAAPAADAAAPASAEAAGTGTSASAAPAPSPAAAPGDTAPAAKPPSTPASAPAAPSTKSPSQGSA